jgi:hypothetical protein
MPQISSIGALPDPGPRINSTSSKTGLTNAVQKNPGVSSPPATDEAHASPLQAQLTRLSSVLNSLQTNATANSAQLDAVSSQVKSGTYSVDSLDVSRSMVSDLLANHA